MLLRLFVVVDAHKENVAGVVGYLCGIFLALDLVDGSVGGMIEFQFNSMTSAGLLKLRRGIITRSA